MTQKPYLLFDAGGVLVFPDHALTAQIANVAGLEVDGQTLSKAHARLFRDFDQYVADRQSFPVIDYLPDLFNRISNDPQKARAAAEWVKKSDQKRSLWTSTRPWVIPALEQLREQGYRMSVISNSDGRVETILGDLGLRSFFEIVIDSFVVGVEKPDPKIFTLALEKLNLDPKNALYIGDLYFIDVWGANQSQIGAVHVDLMNLYNSWQGARIPSIQQLPDWLAQFNGQIPSEILFPARGFEIKQE